MSIPFFCRSSLSSFLKTSNKLNGAAVTTFRAQYSVSAVRQLQVTSARHGTSAGEGFHRPSELDKKILVWTKRFPDVASVPEEVTNTKMKKAKDVFRIRVSIMMALVTMALCVVYINSGKKAVRRGESIATYNKDRHAEYNQENEKK